MSEGAVLAAIECLKDLGMTREEIRERITKWIDSAGRSGDWRDLPPENQMHLARAMQKFFESSFNANKINAA